MKTFILFLGLISLSGYSQNCSVAVNNTVFQQHYTQMAIQLTDQNRLTYAQTDMVNQCFTANQIKLMALLFLTDNDRLIYCKISYPRMVDKNNVYDVYDAFQSFSAAFKFHDFVHDFDMGTTIQTNTNSLDFPNYNYPSWLASNNSCGAPISDSEFNVIANAITVFNTDEEKMANAVVYFNNNCFSMAQAMKIASLINAESSKETFLESVFKYISDKSNYGSATQCFSAQSLKDKWIAFCENYFKPPCNVNENDFNQMLKKIDDANFATDQLPIVKVLNNSSCFSTAQVKRIMDEFSFPENKLDVAVILYKKCTDREKYYQLKGEFSFPTYESEFQDLIGG